MALPLSLTFFESRLGYSIFSTAFLLDNVAGGLRQLMGPAIAQSLCEVSLRF